MIIISYDISNDRLRTRFANFIKKFGNRMQYSVYEINNSKRILENIMLEIKNNFEKSFSETDSIILIETSENCKITKWGYASHDDNDIIIVE